MKKKKLLSVLVAAALGCSLFSAVPVVSQAADTTGVNMYRLYNPNSGEHLYTNSVTEQSNLVSIGWNDEGIGWIAPEKSNTPVYRLYNSNSGDHHYTTSSVEREACITAGWNDEGIGWYSDDNKTVPLYREFNPYETVGTHNYTTDKAEHNHLVSIGWLDEDIGWYAIGDGKKIGDTIILGTYEQDNDLTNGPEPIEWQYVADRDGHKFLLSKYALDHMPYDEDGYAKWEDCTLRKWLNEDFYNTAFSASDKKRIVTAHNENPDSYDLYSEYYKRWSLYNFGYEGDDVGDEGGNATDDKVFLLSWTEARDYLDGKPWDYDPATEGSLQDKDTVVRLENKNYNQKLLCKPTVYAKAQGAEGLPTNPDNELPPDATGCCTWWLRSPGTYARDAASVAELGYLSSSFKWCLVPVRPAILID